MSAPKFSLALGAKKLGNKTAESRPKRTHTTFATDDDEEQEGQVAEVTHFDVSAGGAVDSRAKKDEGPLVIPVQKNRGWNHAKRRKTETTQETNGQSQQVEESESTPVKYGLQILEREPKDDKAHTNGNTHENGQEPAAPAKTVDEEALEALITGKKSNNLVVPLAQQEEEAFRKDYASAPDAPTLEDYNRIDVSQFGEAMLRGMGWKGEDSTASKPKEIVRRPALLGLGAKPEAAAGIEEPGAWGKAAGGGRGKVKKAYAPLMLVNKKTGEKLTEEQLKEKLERQKLLDEEEAKEKTNGPKRRVIEYEDEKLSRRKRRDEYSDDEDERRPERRRRERDRNDDRDRKHKSSWRDRDGSDEDREERRRREKRRERERDDDRRPHKSTRERDSSRDRDRDRRRKEEHRDRDRRHRDR